jgi:predicted alpha/beta-fold hydrolase
VLDKSSRSNSGSFVARKFSFLVNAVAPAWSTSKIDDLLITPKANGAKTARVPDEIKQLKMKTIGGAVHIYRIGSGPSVVFVHGWGGGAYQFFPLMRGLSKCGFTAVAFDHLGHGQSHANAATLQQSIATTNHILHFVKNKFEDGLCAIVGHSSGCIAIANARPALVKDLPLFLISPIFNYKLYMLKRLVQLDLHEKLVKKYASRFTNVYNREFKKLELARHLDKYGDVTVIAHDETDSDSPVADSVKFCKRYPLTRLLVTREYDHVRIINSESVWQELKSHLNYEDTTVNFVQEILRNPIQE